MPIPKIPKKPGSGKGASVSPDMAEGATTGDSGLVQVLQDNADAIANAIDKALVTALEECGLLGERFAKENLSEPKGGHKSGKDPRPNVDTGRLRASITHQISEAEKAVYIGTNVEYARYVELGTEHMKGWPYLKPAASAHGSDYRQVFEKHLKNG